MTAPRVYEERCGYCGRCILVLPPNVMVTMRPARENEAPEPGQRKQKCDRCGQSWILTVVDLATQVV